MTDNNIPNKDQPPVRGPGVWHYAGAFLSFLCVVAGVFTYFELQKRQLASNATSGTQAGDHDDGRSSKQFKLVPQKDGTMIAKEVSSTETDNPWDADGIEDFSFTDADGKTITKQDLLGKPFVIAFVFTMCRGPCPNVTLQMREIQNRMKEYDFNLVTLTVDPDRDTIDVLHKYGINEGADFDRWKFLTGNQPEIYGLIHRSFKMPVKEVTGPDRLPGFEIIHSTNIMLVDSSGRVAGKFNAQKDEEMAKLRKEIKRLAKPKNDVNRVEEGQP